MITLEAIKKYYPAHLHGFERELLREYLQCQILQILFDSPLGKHFAFLGGTCLRLVHENKRFSEDLDFDNFAVSAAQFDQVAEIVEKELKGSGYEVEIQVAGKGAYRCNVKFPRLFFQHGLSGYQEEKLLIQLDSEAQNFPFEKETYILNRFGIFSQINVTPLDLMFSQKCYAILNRPRNKGRDFFDVVFLLGLNVKPNYAYLAQKVGITTATQLKERLLAHCEKLNMDEQGRDVASFLFTPSDVRMVTLFPQIIKQAVI
ncbi:nucleotidyl transferase AbiEii/AbiGii toxin family protein [Runella zeae]|uniref:nucleotidyl transferase AbiEii/AbiGii toxin family protein n=1 Tax=Runella zeae TaxID=94255 RepID=UPI0003F9E26E|nr:nucleotidyl transferase AbiEii/AbiGii toxin family protein [Runella zeae]